MNDAPDSEYATNLGWWTDKPDRKQRKEAQSRSRYNSVDPGLGVRVWLRCALIVGLMFTLGLSLRLLMAGW